MQGEKLAHAYAVLSLVTDNFRRARERIQQDSRQAQDSVEGIGRKSKRAGDEAAQGMKRADDSVVKLGVSLKRLNNTRLDRVTEGLERIQGVVAAVSVAASGATLFGTQQARQMQNQIKQIEVLLGGTEIAQKQIESLRQLSDDLKSPFAPMLDSLAQMAPLIKSTGADADRLMMVANQLAVLDPSQGAFGARIALSEFFSGDIMSLMRRFDISFAGRDELNQIVDDANGDVNEMLRALEELFNSAGLTRDAMLEINAVDPFPRLKSNLQEAMATAFNPFLNQHVIPTVEGFNEFLTNIRQTNPELLAMAGGMTASVAGGSALLLVLTQIASAYKAIKDSALLAGGAQNKFIKAGVTVAALGVGVEAGKGIATRLADMGIGNQRLRSDSGEDAGSVLWETVGQGATIIVNLFLDKVFRPIVHIVDRIIHAFRMLVDIGEFTFTFFQEFVAVLRQVMGKIQLAIADFLYAIGRGDEAGMTNVAGAYNVVQGESDQLAAQRARGDIAGRLAQGYTQERSATIDARIDALVNDATLATGRLMGVIPTAIEEAAEDIQPEVQQAVEQVVESIFNQDQITAFGEFQDDLVDIEAKRVEDREKQETQHTERMQTIRDRYHQRMEDKEESHHIALSRAGQDHQRDLQQRIRDAGRKDLQTLHEQDKAIQKAQEEAQKAREQTEKDHQQKLQDIQRQGRLAIIQAARNLDAVGVLDALRKRREETQKANEEHAEKLAQIDIRQQETIQKEREGAQERLQANQEALELELQQMRQQHQIAQQRRIEDHQRAMQALEEQREAELEKEGEVHQQKLAEIDLRAQQEAQQREQAFMEEFNQLATHEQAKLDIQRKGQVQLEREMTAWFNRMSSNIRSTNARTASQSTYSSNAGERVTRTSSGSTIAPGVRKAMGFAVGTRFVPETGRYTLHRGEAILNPAITRQVANMLGSGWSQNQLVGALAGGGGMTIDNLVVNNHDVGNASPDMIRQMTAEGVQEAIVDFMRRFS
jgi:hypothetical protein